MKFLSLALSFFLLCGMNSLKAQTPSTYDANGKVKSVETRRYEESRNKQNNTVAPSTPASAKPTPKTTAGATPNSLYYDAAAAEADRQRKIKEAAARAVFINRAVAKYQEVDTAAYRSEGNYIRVRSNGKYGFVDITGAEVIPLIYDELSNYYIGDGFKARIGNKWGVINAQGKAIIKIQYDELKEFVHNYDYATKSMKFMAFAKMDGKYGYLGTMGEAIIPVIYDELEVNPCCDHDLYAAKLNGKWGFLDNNGTVKIPFQFSSVVKKFTFPYDKTPQNSENGYFKKNSALATVIKDNARFDINIGGMAEGPKTDIITGKKIVETLTTGSFTDARDNHIYQTIQIGSQVWMAENLDVSQFNNGDKIAEAGTDKEWTRAAKKKNPASCYYDNDQANGKLGKLYNFYAVSDPRGLAPAGWHIPTHAEWQSLISASGGLTIAWKTLVHPGWSLSGNKNGFAALPAGYRDTENGKAPFLLSNYGGKWWSSTVSPPKYAYYYVITPTDMRDGLTVEMGMGLSVRCIKDSN